MYKWGLCPIYFFVHLGGSVSEVSADPWRAILQEALATNPPPVVGTHFRSAVDTAAAKHELRFPPAGQPVLRFIQLLERYPDVVSILRRPGQDFLVAPSDRADLLAKGIQDRFFGIRNDLFQAFTIISENQAFYDKALVGNPVEGEHDSGLKLNAIPL